MLGVSTGGRISELLSLTIGDVYQNRAAVTDLLYDRSIVKSDAQQESDVRYGVYDGDTLG